MHSNYWRAKVVVVTSF